MALQPICFGNFNFGSEECKICSEFNIDCIFKSLQQELCFSNAIQGNMDLCNSSACPESIEKSCTSARYILTQIKKKSCFSQPKSKDTECFHCDFFDDCEAADLMRQNLNLDIYKAKDLLKSQISEMLAEEGQCFGDFSFEKVCWDECQWTVRCLKMSGIIPGKNCKYYDKVYPPQCASCNFKDFCEEIRNAKLETEKIVSKSTKIFRNFYNINEIRGFTEVANEK